MPRIPMLAVLRPRRTLMCNHSKQACRTPHLHDRHDAEHPLKAISPHHVRACEEEAEVKPEDRSSSSTISGHKQETESEVEQSGTRTSAHMGCRAMWWRIHPMSRCPGPGRSVMCLPRPHPFSLRSLVQVSGFCALAFLSACLCFIQLTTLLLSWAELPRWNTDLTETQGSVIRGWIPLAISLQIYAGFK